MKDFEKKLEQHPNKKKMIKLKRDSL